VADQTVSRQWGILPGLRDENGKPEGFKEVYRKGKKSARGGPSAAETRLFQKKEVDSNGKKPETRLRSKRGKKSTCTGPRLLP